MTTIQNITHSLTQTDNPHQSRETEKNAALPQSVTHNPESSTQDTVSITDRLSHLKNAIQNLPVVDVERDAEVEKIKQKVEQGTYTIDHGKVASKLLNTEKLLG